VRRAAIAKARSEAGRKGAASRWQIASESAPKHSKKNGKTWQTDSKAMAKNAPGPVPFASKEAKKIRARETVRAESPAGPATASAPSGGGQKKHQPRTTGATRCPHTPMCPSYDACIQRTLDDANARS